ncbi:MAG: O-antigen ligase family protein, partial [Brevinematia bacterium]
LFYNGEFKQRLFHYITFSVIFTSLILSTSKFYVIIILFSLIVLFYLVFIFQRLSILSNLNFKKNLLFSFMSFFSVFGISIFLLEALPNFIASTSSVSISSKYNQVLENAEETGIGPRLEEMKKTFQVAIKNPFIGTSLGGVAPHKALMSGVVPKSNEDVKPYEGMNVFVEIIAGLGIFGALVLLSSWGILSYQSWIFSFGLLKVGRYFESIVLFSMVMGFVLEFVLLFWNQNVLRFYFWNHLALLGFILGKVRDSFSNQT